MQVIGCARRGAGGACVNERRATVGAGSAQRIRNRVTLREPDLRVAIRCGDLTDQSVTRIAGREAVRTTAIEVRAQSALLFSEYGDRQYAVRPRAIHPDRDVGIYPLRSNPESTRTRISRWSYAHPRGACGTCPRGARVRTLIERPVSAAADSTATARESIRCPAARTTMPATVGSVRGRA